MTAKGRRRSILYRAKIWQQWWKAAIQGGAKIKNFATNPDK
jgi:hypothetical protein